MKSGTADRTPQPATAHSSNRHGSGRYVVRVPRRPPRRSPATHSAAPTPSAWTSSIDGAATAPVGRGTVIDLGDTIALRQGS